MYGLFARWLPPPLAEAATIVWYCGLVILILYFSSYDQARFAYAEF
jgi:hypothetical protein